MDDTTLEEMVRTDLYNAFQCLGWEDQDAENVIENIEIYSHHIYSPHHRSFRNISHIKTSQLKL